MRAGRWSAAALPPMAAATWVHCPSWQKSFTHASKADFNVRGQSEIAYMARIIKWTPKSRGRGQEKSGRFSLWALDALVLTVAGIRTQRIQTVNEHSISANQHPSLQESFSSAAPRMWILPTTRITRTCFLSMRVPRYTSQTLRRGFRGAHSRILTKNYKQIGKQYLNIPNWSWFLMVGAGKW